MPINASKPPTNAGWPLGKATKKVAPAASVAPPKINDGVPSIEDVNSLQSEVEGQLLHEAAFVGAGNDDALNEVQQRKRLDLIATEKLIAHVAEMLAQRKYKSQIKEAIYKACGVHCSPATVEKVISRARDLLRAQAAASVADFKNEAIEVYRSIIRDPHTSDIARIKAQEQLLVLVGADPRFRSGQGIDAGQNARDIQAALKAMDTSSVGEPVQPTE